MIRRTSTGFQMWNIGNQEDMELALCELQSQLEIAMLESRYARMELTIFANEVEHIRSLLEHFAHVEVVVPPKLAAG